MDGFNADQILKTLAEHGVTRSDYRGAMKVQVAARGDRTDIYLNDPDGLIVQLQDATYCGGGGRLGATCSAVEPSSKKGLIALKDYSHAVFSTDSQRSNEFYKQLFGLSIRSYQGPTAPTLAVGPTVEFLMFTGGGPGRGAAGAAPPPPRPASINHFCMNLASFNADQVVKALESYGIKPREAQTDPGSADAALSACGWRIRGGTKRITVHGILVQFRMRNACGGSGCWAIRVRRFRKPRHRALVTTSVVIFAANRLSTSDRHD